ncbi:hypothetical protein BURK2_04550 [Burkholderiales bacterium]|nr:MAG: hypothetical protein F9K47_04205 [Burkholderiales bacterium]CAG1012584.1 hypothetical protein BURK2_04550 [Burkholderiales bacterium]
MIRNSLALIGLAALFTGCASTAPNTTPAAAEKKPETAKVAQCYSGDAGRFFNVGERTSISGLEVTCTATSDGKNGQWMSAKHHK